MVLRGGAVMNRKKHTETGAKTIITVTAVTALSDYMLKVTFSSRETKIFDFKPYLSAPVFNHLKDHGLFSKCYISCGSVTWDDNTDISTDLLYFEGIKLEDYYK